MWDVRWEEIDIVVVSVIAIESHAPEGEASSKLEGDGPRSRFSGKDVTKRLAGPLALQPPFSDSMDREGGRPREPPATDQYTRIRSSSSSTSGARSWWTAAAW